MPRPQYLYEDVNININYHPNFVMNDTHLLWMHRGDEGANYILERGILESLAKTRRGELAAEIEQLHPGILARVESMGIGIDGLHVAICQAFTEERRWADESSAHLP